MEGISKLRRAAVITAAVAAAITVSAASIAGPRYSVPGVTILKNADGSGHAYGTLGGTRNSTSTVEWLSCTVSRSENFSANPPSRSTVVSCSANDKNNVSVYCSSTLETLADALNGLANDGLIDLFYDANGTCTSISVYESSSLERKR